MHLFVTRVLEIKSINESKPKIKLGNKSEFECTKVDAIDLVNSIKIGLIVEIVVEIEKQPFLGHRKYKKVCASA